MARIMLVGADMVAANAVQAAHGYTAPPGYVAIASETAKIGDILDPVTGEFSTPVQPVEMRRAWRLEQVRAMKEHMLAQGAPYAGKRIEVDDATRANLSGMALTALMVVSNVLPEWPTSYAQGWITADNSRVELPTPMSGIQLAATAAGWYSSLVQYARDAKNSVLTAEDPDAAFLALDWSPWQPAPIT